MGTQSSAADAIPAPRYLARIATAADARARIRQLPRPLVFTNGVFDVLHRGHVTCLDQARSLGASLVVAVNSDASVRRLGKGGDRPLNPLEDRMAVLAALASVDSAE
jgi:D-glycero-beta-D-manno-heptose 1-phosphate adenylyltransferase